MGLLTVVQHAEGDAFQPERGTGRGAESKLRKRRVRAGEIRSLSGLRVKKKRARALQGLAISPLCPALCALCPHAFSRSNASAKQALTGHNDEESRKAHCIKGSRRPGRMWRSKTACLKNTSLTEGIAAQPKKTAIMLHSHFHHGDDFDHQLLKSRETGGLR